MTAERWVFIGDSITDTGRREDPAGHGDGYVSRIREQLLVSDPACTTEILNRGVSGDTVRQLRQRWQSDVTALRPDLLSVKIGVNDVWRSFDGAPEQAVNADEYRPPCAACSVKPAPWTAAWCSSLPFWWNRTDESRCAARWSTAPGSWPSWRMSSGPGWSSCNPPSTRRWPPVRRSAGLGPGASQRSGAPADRARMAESGGALRLHLALNFG